MYASMAKIVRLSPMFTDLVGCAWDNVPPLPQDDGTQRSCCARGTAFRVLCKVGRGFKAGWWLRQRWVMRRLGSSV